MILYSRQEASQEIPPSISSLNIRDAVKRYDNDIANSSRAISSCCSVERHPVVTVILLICQDPLFLRL